MPTKEQRDATPELPIALESTSVVVRGGFNPAIFSPAWFKLADLVGEDEYADSAVDVVSAEITTFRMGWLEITATLDSLQFLTTAVEEVARLRDAAVGTLRTLEYTPVSALGINQESHTLLPSPEALHLIGDTLAPKDIWSDVLEFPGVRQVLMWGARDDGWLGRLNVRVEPSQRAMPGVYIHVNSHYDLEKADTAATSRNDAYARADEVFEPTSEKRLIAIELLLNDWTIALEKSANIQTRIRSIALEVN